MLLTPLAEVKKILEWYAATHDQHGGLDTCVKCLAKVEMGNQIKKVEVWS